MPPGQNSQTADQVAAIDGANGAVGDLAVLNARLAPTEGDELPGTVRRPAAPIDLRRQPRRGQAQRYPHLGREVSEDQRGPDACPGKRWPISAAISGKKMIVTGFLQDQYYGGLDADDVLLRHRGHAGR